MENLNSFEEVKNFSESCFTHLIPEDLCEKAPFLYAANAFIAFMGASAESFFYFVDKMYENWETIADEFPEMMIMCYLLARQDHRTQYSKTCEWADENIFGRFGTLKWRHAATITHNMPYLHRGTRDYSELTDRKVLERCTVINRALNRGIDTSDIFYRALETGLLLEQFRLDEALAVALKNMAETSEGSLHEFRFASLMSLAAVYEAMDNMVEYSHVMQEIEKFTNCTYIFLRPNFLSMQTAVQLMRGDQDAAKIWLEHYFIRATQRMKIYEIPLYFTTLRALILLGRFDDAQAFVTRFREMLKNFGRGLDLAYLDVLDSIMKWYTGQQTEAADLLFGALLWLEPYGYIRPVAIEGAAVSPILKRLALGRKNKKLPVSRKFFLKVQVQTAARAKKQEGIACYLNPQGLKLTKQQKRILGMLAEGKSNKEIAGILGRTVGTVKWHAMKIYAKLKVHNVNDAVSKAWELGLLEKHGQ